MSICWLQRVSVDVARGRTTWDGHFGAANEGRVGQPWVCSRGMFLFFPAPWVLPHEAHLYGRGPSDGAAQSAAEDDRCQTWPRVRRTAGPAMLT